jgi:dihydrofolate reductase
VQISLIAALDHRHLIGDGMEIPWHLPADFRRFKELTFGHPIVMGRRTHESLGRPLPGRLNIVLSGDRDYEPAEGCVRARSIDEAVERADEEGDELYVCGGAGVYRSFMPRAERMLLSVVYGVFEGDVYFPAFSLEDWRIELRALCPADERNGYAHTFFEIHRRDGRTPQGRAHRGEWLPEVMREL